MTTRAGHGALRAARATTRATTGRSRSSPTSACRSSRPRPATGPDDDWADDEAGLTPLDVAMGVAIPEFDGRIIGPAFAFKEVVDDGDELGTPAHRHRTDPERVEPGWPAWPCASPACAASRRPTSGSRSCCRPTRRSAAGSATPSALDTPGLACSRLLARPAGRRLDRVDRIPDDGDALMAELADRLHLRRPELTAGPARRGRRPAARAADYTAWFADAARSSCGVASIGASRRARSTSPRRRPRTASAHSFRRARPRRRAGGHPAAAGVRGRPDRHVPRRPTCRRPTTTSPSTAGCDAGLGRRRRRPPRQARHPRVAARQGHRALSAACIPDAASATCRSSTRSSSTTPARARRPSAAPTP